MTSSTKCTGIRISTELYEIARTANPGKTFSEIVRGALEEKYGFVTFEEVADEKAEVFSVEEKVDIIFKKKEELD